MPAAAGAPVSPTSVVRAVERLIGDPYRYGAAGPSAFDCSGLMQYVYGLVGVSLPRTSQEQYRAGTAVAESQLQPGDLAFAAGVDGTAAAPGHVGMYVGERSGVPSVVEAPHTGALVRYTPLAQFGAVGYRRVLGSASGGAADASWLIPGLTDQGISGLLGIPGQITDFFAAATDDLAGAARFFSAFGRPSTWVRIGAGGLGTLLLIAGLALLIAAAAKGGGAS